MYLLILIPILVGAITQAIKLIIDGIPNNFTWQHLYRDYGGMPSSHTAFVASLATVIGLREGLNSAAFAIALILMLVVIRDAVGFRREIGKNAILTNYLAKKLIKDKKIPLLTERVGHKISEVAAGVIFGGALSALIYFIFMII
ncbi:MAG: divergent PAP2 family protein [Candidatus Buchananbacteria bacterium]